MLPMVGSNRSLVLGGLRKLQPTAGFDALSKAVLLKLCYAAQYCVRISPHSDPKHAPCGPAFTPDGTIKLPTAPAR